MCGNDDRLARSANKKKRTVTIDAIIAKHDKINSLDQANNTMDHDEESKAMKAQTLSLNYYQ